MSDIALDRLADRGADAVQVLLLAGMAIGGAGVREPHRHDYHELIWVREGSGRHLIDGAPVGVRPLTVTLIGRGQVHVFERASGLEGAVLRFTDEAVLGSGQAWLLAGRGGRTVDVPPPEADRLDGIVSALHAEVALPPDARTAELVRHLLGVVLLWTERWYDAARSEAREPGDAEVQLQRRFARLLESDFARHHDAAHYADALAVPPAALSRALAEATGRTTKELITERAMLEAARLLRFTDLPVQEVGRRAGYDDPLYFSRAFKRHRGEPPVAYRDRVRGKSMHS
jgi:AraC family transcriptional activator of pobA